MTRNSLFWGSIFILAGILLLLDNLGLLTVSAWSLIWPLVLIAFGLWTLWRYLMGTSSPPVEEAAIPLEDATRARIHLRHGIGRLHLTAGAGQDELATGTFSGGLDYYVRRDGDLLDVDMRPSSRSFPEVMMPWNWGSRGAVDWSVALNGEVPLSLYVETGASDTRLDLSELHVTELRLQTGASSTNLKLPANAGYTRADLRAGAASLNIQVPSGTAARIQINGGLAGIKVDASRFPRMGNVYQSADYEMAPNRIDVDIQAGVGAIDIR
jgi:hypothetical protein